MESQARRRKVEKIWERQRVEMKQERSQTSHDLLIKRLNTADVFYASNIIIFSMRTYEACLNKLQGSFLQKEMRKANSKRV